MGQYHLRVVELPIEYRGGKECSAGYMLDRCGKPATHEIRWLETAAMGAGRVRRSKQRRFRCTEHALEFANRRECPVDTWNE